MSGKLLHDLILTLPIAILSCGALLLMLVESFSKPAGPSDKSIGLRDALPLYTILFALITQIWLLGVDRIQKTAFEGLLYIDDFAWFGSFVILLGALGAAVAGLTRLTKEGITARSEYYVLYLIATAGALIFACAGELITLFLGLEIMSLALYCLCGSSLSLRGPAMKRSSESALKYFLLGSFSSAFLLYGIALLYGLSGSTSIAVVAAKASSVNQPMFMFAVGLVLVGVAFKIGAVPFHFWVPDVYQGAPTPVTAFMACAVKSAAVIAALRLFWRAGVRDRGDAGAGQGLR